MDWTTLPPDRLGQLCAEPGSARAWEEFMRRYHPVLTAAAARVSRQWGSNFREETDDIVQDIYLHLCADHARVLTAFRDPRPEAMFGFLKAVSTHVAHDFFRRRHAAKRDDKRTESVDHRDALAAPIEELDRSVSLAEIDRMLEHQTKDKDNGRRDRAVFRLYYRHGLTARAIAELPGIGLNTKGVEGVVLRLTRSIKQAFGSDTPSSSSDVSWETPELGGAQGSGTE